MLVTLLGCGKGSPSPEKAPPTATPDQTLTFLPEVGSPALALGIASGSTVLYKRVEGVRIQGKPAAASLQDRWSIGSTTKAMTPSSPFQIQRGS